MNKLMTFFIIVMLLIRAMSLPAMAAEDDPIPKVFGEEPMLVTITSEPEPMLISEYPEGARSNDEIVRGYFISYENDILMMALQETGEEVALIDVNGDFAEIFEQMQAEDYIEIAANRSTDILIVTAFLGGSPRMDGPLIMPTPIIMPAPSDPYVFYLGEVVITPVPMQQIDGKMMVPLRATLEAMGYTVSWNNETKSVEMLRGAQWTSITIGENRYFHNRVAPYELSMAPVLFEGHTMIPAEFYNRVLQKGIGIENSNLYLHDSEIARYSGFIESIDYGENNHYSILISSVKDSTEMGDKLVVHGSNATTYDQLDLVEGAFINVIADTVIMESFPPQVNAIILY